MVSEAVVNTGRVSITMLVGGSSARINDGHPCVERAFEFVTTERIRRPDSERVLRNERLPILEVMATLFI